MVSAIELGFGGSARETADRCIDDDVDNGICTCASAFCRPKVCDRTAGFGGRNRSLVENVFALTRVIGVKRSICESLLGSDTLDDLTGRSGLTRDIFGIVLATELVSSILPSSLPSLLATAFCAARLFAGRRARFLVACTSFGASFVSGTDCSPFFSACCGPRPMMAASRVWSIFGLLAFLTGEVDLLLATRRCCLAARSDMMSISSCLCLATSSSLRFSCSSCVVSSQDAISLATPVVAAIVGTDEASI